jgi:hypothetical protein
VQRVANPLHLPTPATSEAEIRVDVPLREAVGAIGYAANGTRPDLVMAVALISPFVAKPTVRHWDAVKRILRYVKGTLGFGVFFPFGALRGGEDGALVGWADADFASAYDRRSTSGGLITYGGAVVEYWSRKQASVALSSTEAELVSVSVVAQSIIFIRRVLQEMGLPQDQPTVIMEDNQAVLAIVQRAYPSSKLKHVQVRDFFVKDQVESGKIQLKYVRSSSNLADVFTKALARQAFERLRQAITHSE